MTKNFPLRNFDHGLTIPKKFKIGQYQLEVDSTHCKNISLLERGEATQFLVDENLQRVVSKKDKIKGGLEETARLLMDDSQMKPSVLFDYGDKLTFVDDFVVFLSFLTGRRIFVGEVCNFEFSLGEMFSVVNKNFFNIPIVDVDGGFKRLCDLGLTTQFYNIVNAKTFRDMPAICFYMNTIINTIYDKWCSINNYSKYPEPLVDIEIIKNKIKAVTADCLSDQNISSTVLDDIVARVSISNEPSAIYKLQKFLVGMGMFSDNPSADSLARLKFVNKVRNKIMHTGDIPSYKNLGFDRCAEIATGITFMLMQICEYYFAKEIFQIDNYAVDENLNQIRSYFDTGIFMGHSLFDESYAEFVSRRDSAWVQDGIFL